jgi:transcriptional regulator with XRE-family HTH domain
MVSRLAGQEPTPKTELDNVGGRLRQRRLAKRMTLREVADATGLSEGFLSQLERGRHAGSIATLQKVAAVLGLAVGDLFDDSWTSAPQVRRFSEHQGFEFGILGRKIRLTPRPFNHLEAFLGIFEAGGSTGVEPYNHGDSEELLLVIDGEVEVVVGDATHRLGTLDSVTYSSKEPHSVTEVGGATARVVWAMSPPSY